MNGKERIIYSNYYNAELFEETKEYLFDEHNDGKWDSIEDVPDEKVWDEINFMNDITWEDERARLMEFFDSGYFLLQGDVGTWRGNMRGGYVIRGYYDLVKAWNDCDYVKIYDVNGHFYIECSHHDGTNFYEVKELTDKGYDYIDRHCWDSEEEVHNKVFNSSNYSRLPHFAHKMYGCKKREVA